MSFFSAEHDSLHTEVDQLKRILSLDEKIKVKGKIKSLEKLLRR